MIIRDITPTPGLLEMLRSRQDDGTDPLMVTVTDESPDDVSMALEHGWPIHPAEDLMCSHCHGRIEPRAATIVITRTDCSELSETEQAHVRATIAAHKVQPL